MLKDCWLCVVLCLQVHPPTHLVVRFFSGYLNLATGLSPSENMETTYAIPFAFSFRLFKLRKVTNQLKKGLFFKKKPGMKATY